MLQHTHACTCAHCNASQVRFFERVKIERSIARLQRLLAGKV